MAIRYVIGVFLSALFLTILVPAISDDAPGTKSSPPAGKSDEKPVSFQEWLKTAPPREIGERLKAHPKRLRDASDDNERKHLQAEAGEMLDKLISMAEAGAAPNKTKDDVAQLKTQVEELQKTLAEIKKTLRANLNPDDKK